MPQKLSFPSRAPARRAERPAAFVQTDGASIDIYGDIGFWGITAADVLARLRAIPADAEISLRINSGGGDVFEAIAIYNDLVAHQAPVKVLITGIAASAASLICMAADEIAMAPGSKLMIHNAGCFGQGTATYFDSLAGDLRSIDAPMAQAYAARCGKPASEIAAMMDAETWLDCDKAVEMGLADRVEGEMKTAPATTAAAVAKPRAKTAHPRFVKRSPFSLKTVAALETLADNLERTGYARNA